MAGWPVGKSSEVVEQEIEAARRAGDQEREAQLLILLGDSLLGAGDLRQGEALLREALVLLEPREVAFASLPVLLKCASLSRDRGAYRQASKDLEQAISLSRTLEQRGNAYGSELPGTQRCDSRAPDRTWVAFMSGQKWRLRPR